MDVFAILAVMVAFAIGWFFGGGPAPAQAPADLEKVEGKPDKAPRNLDDELKKAKKALADEKAKREKQGAELSKLQKNLKKAKQRAHDAEKQTEQFASSLRAKAESLKEKARSGGADAREQMLLAEQRAANLELEVKRLRDALESGGSAAPVAAAPAPAAPVAAVSGDEGVDDRVARLESALKSQRREMRDAFNEQVAKERDKLFGELRDLRKRQSRTLHELDRERRRADNTDKAYIILKGQLEATLDRLAQTGAVRRPDMITREDVRRSELERAEAAHVAHVAAAEEAAAVKATEIADAEPTAPVDSDTTEQTLKGASDDLASEPTDDATEAPIDPPMGVSGVAPAPGFDQKLDLASLDDGWDIAEAVARRVTGDFAAVPSDD